MVKLVLLILLLQSIFSWAIILYKVNLLRKIEKETSSFYDLFWKKRDLRQMYRVTKNYPNSPLTRIFKDAYAEAGSYIEAPPRERSKSLIAMEGTGLLRRILKKTISIERAGMEKSASFLATTGSTAPFIGLFGTVWGIMNTFRSIGAKGGASLAVVAPGISEALIATAMGLFAAIPAVVGYNYIIARTDRIAKEMEAFSTDLVTLIEKTIGGFEGQGRNDEEA